MIPLPFYQRTAQNRRACVSIRRRAKAEAEINAPVGFDAHGFCFASKGRKVHSGAKAEYGAEVRPGGGALARVPAASRARRMRAGPNAASESAGGISIHLITILCSGHSSSRLGSRADPLRSVSPIIFRVAQFKEGDVIGCYIHMPPNPQARCGGAQALIALSHDRLTASGKVELR